MFPEASKQPCKTPMTCHQLASGSCAAQAFERIGPVRPACSLAPASNACLCNHCASACCWQGPPISAAPQRPTASCSSRFHTLRSAKRAQCPLTQLMVFGGGARLVGPAAVYFGLGQFHLAGVELFAPVEDSLRYGLPCNPLFATLAAYSYREEGLLH